MESKGTRMRHWKMATTVELPSQKAPYRPRLRYRTVCVKAVHTWQLTQKPNHQGHQQAIPRFEVRTQLRILATRKETNLQWHLSNPNGFGNMLRAMTREKSTIRNAPKLGARFRIVACQIALVFHPNQGHSKRLQPLRLHANQQNGVVLWRTRSVCQPTCVQVSSLFFIAPCPAFILTRNYRFSPK
jgi:hypothetical protein